MDDVTIDIEENGPYRVKGVPLSRTAQVETEYGEPVDWAPDDPLETRATYRLCRCGHSQNKPFCDSSHQREGFDGTETAGHRTYAERAYPYGMDGATMPDDQSLCTHAGYCGDRFKNVWAMLREADDPAVRERIRHMVMLCPSGRISFIPEGADEPDEIPYEPSVAVVKDGPIWVRGGVPIRGADGEAYETRNRVTLCRCGRSENKPYCDGTHTEIGFREG
jgi:CDGSH-type Zn-finger protein